MTRLTHLERPANQRADYRFVKDEDSGRRFKVLAHFVDEAGREPELKLSIAEAGEDGHALVGEGQEEPELAWHGHVFRAVELEDPAFDVEARVSAMLHTAVEAREKRIGAKTEIVGLIERKWKGRAAMALVPPPPAMTAEELAANNAPPIGDQA